MERFTPDDALFFDLEDESVAMHNVTVALFDGPEPGFDVFRRRVASSLGLVPRLRQRPMGVPFGIGRPVWVDDPHFNVDYHVRHTAVPAEAVASDGEHQDRAFRNLIGRLQSQRLDRGKPLWEMWLVSGLRAGRFAVVSKAHYSMVDGVSGTDPLALVIDGKHARTDLSSAADDRWVPRARPSDRDLLLRSVSELMVRPSEQLRLGRRVAIAPLEQAVRLMANQSDVDRTGRALGPHRCWRKVDVPACTVDGLRQTLDVTTNDVLLGLANWGIRSMLRGTGETDRSSLRALVPLASATGDHFVNEVNALEADLPVGVDNFTLGVQLINDQTRHVGRRKAVAGDTLADAAGLNAPTLCALGLRSAARVGAGLRTTEIVFVNAPGPNAEITIFGRPMVGLYPAIPLVGRARVSIGVMSYRKRFGFGITGDLGATAEIAAVADGIVEAVASV